MIKELRISTHSRVDFIDITAQAGQFAAESGLKEGMLHIFVPHTTAGITINENADPSVREDMIAQLEKLVPQRGNYKHIEGNSPAHIKSSMIGSSAVLFVRNGELLLGTWQGVYFCEFDGPRARKVFLKISH